jgi:hypothetical protein
LGVVVVEEKSGNEWQSDHVPHAASSAPFTIKYDPDSRERFDYSTVRYHNFDSSVFFHEGIKCKTKRKPKEKKKE